MTLSIFFHHFSPYWIFHNTVDDFLKQYNLTEGQWLVTEVATQGSWPNLGVEEDLRCKNGSSCYDNSLRFYIVATLAEEVPNFGMGNLLGSVTTVAEDQFYALCHFLTVENKMTLINNEQLYEVAIVFSAGAYTGDTLQTRKQINLLNRRRGENLGTRGKPLGVE